MPDCSTLLLLPAEHQALPMWVVSTYQYNRLYQNSIFVFVCCLCRYFGKVSVVLVAVDSLYAFCTLLSHFSPFM